MDCVCPAASTVPVWRHGIVGLSESTLRYWLLEDHGLSIDDLVNVVGEMLRAGLRGTRPHD